MAKGEDLASSPVHPGSQKEPQAVGRYHNSNVSKILPLTTLRTVDLETHPESPPREGCSNQTGGFPKKNWGRLREKVLTKY